MIFFDVTKSASVRHRSGLARMSERLRQELGDQAMPATWREVREHAQPNDWFVTTELFSESERPGFGEFLREPPCHTAAVFADAIPMKHPQITWPQSVARHPHYLKMLARFEKVWAISRASRDELYGYWQWIGLQRVPRVNVLPLGADLRGMRRRDLRGVPAPRALLCIGILEPRKNQTFLLQVCQDLWNSGLKFRLHLVGRVNPHFGKPIVQRIRRMRRFYPALYYHAAAADHVLTKLYGNIRATVFPTIAEGCGLPLLESLWLGVPCVCSDLPVLRENADAGGCLTPELNSREDWRAALTSVLRDDQLHSRLRHEATTRKLPTWAESAKQLREGLVAH